MHRILKTSGVKDEVELGIRHICFMRSHSFLRDIESILVLLSPSHAFPAPQCMDARSTLIVEESDKRIDISGGPVIAVLSRSRRESAVLPFIHRSQHVLPYHPYRVIPS
jgi:hypothetical protein